MCTTSYEFIRDLCKNLSFRLCEYFVVPAKRGTELDRADSRNRALQQALELTKSGDTTTARTYFSRAVDITPRMAAQLIRVLRQHRPSVSLLISVWMVN